MGTGARAWAAALLLAAVLLGHGLQCAAGPAHPGHAAHVPEVSAGPLALAAVDAPVGVTAHHAAPAPSPDATAGDRESNGGLPAHLWATCLAVLAVGLAVLLGIAGVPARRLRRATEPSARLDTTAGQPPPRPPDIFALCVLRT
ncbi:hypothetical protein DQ244_05130 [Blastococcus sp. TBT05-19]|uniref:DUF6153 family protein n=1 Tax=Blastococcus sp. TBT05-19 TaxID=2250581 RepID=UPI000DE98558|nr:DUF6153 family protein [Blastococcus sp. TBT05-19]RBY94670.1 hypothetical protein DQ244_05130 [Blastococcus sp. TBT05-19]